MTLLNWELFLWEVPVIHLLPSGLAATFSDEVWLAEALLL
jgi:hypothetical protein